ncbi:MAG TPA: hypothetical protein VF868_06725 [Bacteroidia bacterium]|jgi:dipeptidyl aminopeptidase/acylaminoacyl peptidase
MKRTIIITITILLATPVFAQLPDTDIWLLDIKSERDTIILSNPVNITNHVGYDNQPAFSPDGKYILYTSIRDEKQSDIYKYDLKTKQISQFCNTPLTSEYSPTFMPRGKDVSVVMVEPDSTQRLWKFPVHGGPPSVLFSHTDSIGYHTWFLDDKAAVFTLTEPPSLMLLGKGKDVKYIDRGIGRCIRQSGTGLYYTKKTEGGKNKFFLFNLPGWSIKNDLVTMIENEDYTFIGEHIIYPAGSALNIVKLGLNDHKTLIDLNTTGIKKITRIAISPDRTKMAIAGE